MNFNLRALGSSTASRKQDPDVNEGSPAGRSGLGVRGPRPGPGLERTAALYATQRRLEPDTRKRSTGRPKTRKTGRPCARRGTGAGAWYWYWEVWFRRPYRDDVV